VDISDPVLEPSALDVILNLTITQSAFKMISCPFWRVLANFERFLQA
jgi:hypothetical protein